MGKEGEVAESGEGDVSAVKFPCVLERGDFCDGRGGGREGVKDGCGCSWGWGLRRRSREDVRAFMRGVRVGEYDTHGSRISEGALVSLILFLSLFLF